MIGRKPSSGEDETSKIKRQSETVQFEKIITSDHTIENDKEDKDIQRSDNPQKTLKVSQLLFKTIKNTSSVFVLSSTTTIINFLCNIPLLRAVSKESFGTVKVYFELAFSLINYIPRETIRRTSHKFCPDKDPVKGKRKIYINSPIKQDYNDHFCIYWHIYIFLFFIFYP